MSSKRVLAVYLTMAITFGVLDSILRLSVEYDMNRLFISMGLDEVLSGLMSSAVSSAVLIVLVNFTSGIVKRKYRVKSSLGMDILGVSLGVLIVIIIYWALKMKE